MNRICKSFDDIGNINLNYAGVRPFNWQMLLSEPCASSRPEIPELFCEMDSSNIASVIENRDDAYSNEKKLLNGSIIVAEDITARIIEKYGSLEYAYPYIVKYLFAGEGINKSAHKQMFWKVFGEIALTNLKKNLATCDTCPDCKVKIPSWVKHHTCIKNSKGFYQCIDCGVMCERTNARQCRCEQCQEQYRSIQKKASRRAKREEQKAIVAARISHLQSSLTET